MSKGAERIKLLIQVLLILIFGYAGIYFLVSTNLWLVAVWMFLFALVAFIVLIRNLEKANRELADFLLSVSMSDFSRTYPATLVKSHRLHEAYQVLINSYLKLRKEKEAGHHFLHMIVEQSGVALMAWEENSHKITFTNPAFLQLFAINHLKSLDGLSRIDSNLTIQIQLLKSHERILIKVPIGKEIQYLSVTSQQVVIDEKVQHIVAFHPINAELDQKELESWQKLMRVMTHEIKNSVIPISTLAEVTNDLMKTDPAMWSAEDWEDLQVSIQTIEKRSKGLVKFVSGYGEVAKMPEPVLKTTEISALVSDVIRLEQAVFLASDTLLSFTNYVGFVSLDIDPEMIEQILINLLKNALEAFEDGINQVKEVSVSLERREAVMIISVVDNGAGMSQDVLDQIFIPFFTTKSGGSGVGLSYSRQVMKAHKGNLKVNSGVGAGTKVELHFWCL